jgi:hypothetical protein
MQANGVTVLLEDETSRGFLGDRKIQTRRGSFDWLLLFRHDINRPRKLPEDKLAVGDV